MEPQDLMLGVGLTCDLLPFSSVPFLPFGMEMSILRLSHSVVACI
jgi:hypothetical protein